MEHRDKIDLLFLINGMQASVIEINTHVMTKEVKESQKQKLYDKRRLYSRVHQKLKEIYEAETGVQLHISEEEKWQD